MTYLCVYLHLVSSLECLVTKRNLSLFVQTFDAQLHIWKIFRFKCLKGHNTAGEDFWPLWVPFSFLNLVFSGLTHCYISLYKSCQGYLSSSKSEEGIHKWAFPCDKTRFPSLPCKSFMKPPWKPPLGREGMQAAHQQCSLWPGCSLYFLSLLPCLSQAIRPPRGINQILLASCGQWFCLIAA